MSTQTTNRRIVDEIFIIRIIACLAVIVHHTPYIVEFRHFEQFLRFNTPTFAFISAFLLFNKYKDVQEWTRASLWHFYKERFSKIFIPYIIWSLVYEWYLSGIGIFHQYTKIGYDLLYGLSSYHLYFICVILQFYLFFPLLKMAFDRWKKKPFRGIGICFLLNAVYLIEAYFFSSTLTHFWSEDTIDNFYFRYLFAWIFYISLGYYVAVYFEEITAFLRKKWPYLLGATAIVSTALYWEYEWTRNIMHKDINSRRPIILLYTPFAMICLYYLSNVLLKAKKLRWLSDAMKFASGFSYGIFLVHPLVYAVFDRMHVETLVFRPLTNNSLELFLLNFLSCIIVSFTAVVMMARVPVLGSMLVTVSSVKKAVESRSRPVAAKKARNASRRVTGRTIAD